MESKKLSLRYVIPLSQRILPESLQWGAKVYIKEGGYSVNSTFLQSSYLRNPKAWTLPEFSSRGTDMHGLTPLPEDLLIALRVVSLQHIPSEYKGRGNLCQAYSDRLRVRLGIHVTNLVW